MLLRLFFVARRCTLARLAFLAFTGFNVLAFTRPAAFLATRDFRKRVLAILVAFVALIGLAFRRFAFTRLAFTFFAMSHLPHRRLIIRALTAYQRAFAANAVGGRSFRNRCNEQRNDAIQSLCDERMDCFASLAMTESRNYSSSTTAPSRMVTRRSICAAMSRLWVAMIAASPEARTS
jgi:hypothetical protein